MSISYQILGKPGRDNALMVWINAGKRMYRLLFDCGENLLTGLSQSDIKSIDYLFLSHLHIDHIAGFDYFFRRIYDRESKPVMVWGPAGTTSIIHHRLQGYIWNLVDNLPGEWQVSEIMEQMVDSKYFFLREGFSAAHIGPSFPFNGRILETEDFYVEAAILNHGIPVIAYAVQEKEGLNIDKKELEKISLQPGPWLQLLKNDKVSAGDLVEIGGKQYNLQDLRDKLLIISKGERLTYLTDFLFDNTANERAAKLINGSNTVVCESQYSTKDKELAEKNFHLTADQAAFLAEKGRAERLVLFHISERYSQHEDYLDILSQARKIFNKSFFPDEWNIFQ